MENVATKWAGRLCYMYWKTIFNQIFYKPNCKKLGIKIKWKGIGINEKAYDQDNKCIIECKKNILGLQK